MKKIAVLLASALFAGFANAGAIWDVSDAANTNCGPHGLWTNGTNTGCSRFYSFQEGSTLTQNDDGTANLVATAVRGASTALINLTFGDYTDDHTVIGTLKGTGNGDESTWEFYRSVQGIVDIDSTIYTITNFAGATAFQVGQGANDKSSDFGGSSWIQGLHSGNAHWDLNMDLTAAVPEPASFLLLGAGLGLLGFRRKLAA